LEVGRSYSVVLCEGKDGGEVRAPLPVKRDILYDDPMLYRAARMGYSSNEPSSLVAFQNFNEEMRRPGVWETGQSAEPSIDNLASLYRPPFTLMHHNIKMRNIDVGVHLFDIEEIAKDLDGTRRNLMRSVKVVAEIVFRIEL
ncbi:hypothetical protein IFM89_000593, partial [Coptis chinensis]